MPRVIGELAPLKRERIEKLLDWSRRGRTARPYIVARVTNQLLELMDEQKTVKQPKPKSKTQFFKKKETDEVS